jgi:hypothetical protein
MMFVAHRKNAYEPPRPVTGIALLLWGEVALNQQANTYFPADRKIRI